MSETTFYCPDPTCRHEWTAELVREHETYYHGLADESDGDCPECGELGCEERPDFEDEETE